MFWLTDRAGKGVWGERSLGVGKYFNNIIIQVVACSNKLVDNYVNLYFLSNLISLPSSLAVLVQPLLSFFKALKTNRTQPAEHQRAGRHR